MNFIQAVSSVKPEMNTLSAKRTKLSGQTYLDYIDKYKYSSNQIETLIELVKKNDLENIFSIMQVSRTEVKAYNAFFTPKINVDYLIDLSAIEYDNRKKINVLEPTAGIGNIISGLVDFDNSNHFIIDAVEYIKDFYNLGSVIFNNFKNINWFHSSLFNYNTTTKYDYIFTNPPFNIKIKGDEVLDVDFLDYSYNLLKDGGKLCAIISSSYMSNKKKKKYATFNKTIDTLTSLDPNNVYIEEFDKFTYDKTITKEMVTGIKMVYIIIKKIPNFTLL
jgi:hypothetical protein